MRNPVEDCVRISSDEYSCSSSSSEISKEEEGIKRGENHDVIIDLSEQSIMDEESIITHEELKRFSKFRVSDDEKDKQSGTKR